MMLASHRKKPDVTADWPAMHGDNMYFRKPSGTWGRLPTSHHLESERFEKDTRYALVYVSDYFYYFGVNAVTIPRQFDRGLFALAKRK